MMKVLLARINNPKFVLNNGYYKGKTLLQREVKI